MMRMVRRPAANERNHTKNRSRDSGTHQTCEVQGKAGDGTHLRFVNAQDCEEPRCIAMGCWL